MSDTRRAHLEPKRYAKRSARRFNQDLKTPKQRRASERRAWKKELKYS